MVVWYGCEGGAGVRFVVWRRYLRSSGEVVQANVICICTWCSPPSAASALGFVFVALSQRMSKGGVMKEQAKVPLLCASCIEDSRSWNCDDLDYASCVLVPESHVSVTPCLACDVLRSEHRSENLRQSSQHHFCIRR